MEKRSLSSVLTDAVVICPVFQYIGSAHFVNQKFAELVLSNKPVFPLYRKDSTISTKTCRFRFRSNHLHTRALPQVSILIFIPRGTPPRRTTGKNIAHLPRSRKSKYRNCQKKERPFSLSRKIYSKNRTLLRINILRRLALRYLILSRELFDDLFPG